MIYRIKQYSWILIVFIIFINLSVSESRADDTCMFSVTADEVPPNIVILLDNGAEMQQVQWLSSYDNGVDYTPIPAENDVVKTGGSGSGFLNPNGYGMVEHGGYYYLVEIEDDLEPAGYTEGLQATSSDSGDGTGVWTINDKTVTLPSQASAVEDTDGIKDNAGMLRYSQNYLNWIFFSGLYTGNGSDLERRSRFYNAKKAILNVAKLASNLAYFGIYNFANDEGASSVQPLSMVVDTVNTPATNNVLDPAFINNINNMGTFTYSPLAEGLATIGGLYDSPSSATFTEWVETYCQKNFVIVVSPGLSSMDLDGANQYLPQTLSDYDADDGGIGEGNIEADSTSYSIPTNYNGSTLLDDVAHYMYTHDMVGYEIGFQNVTTYTVGFMGDLESNLFLINASNNGNGNPNLYNTIHPEYGKYHFTAESPDDLTSVLLDAVNSILSQNMTYTSPVVPVTKTMSGNKIYLAFFKPLDENFWEGNIVKLGINEDLEVVDKNGDLATWPNGAMRDDIKYYWSTKDWADTSTANGIFNASRNILTYMGGARNLITDGSNFFKSSNDDLTPEVLGNPTHSTAQIIDYVRGADVFDEDADTNVTENRAVITGDVLHSQPLVVQYVYPDDSALSMVFFGSNDGMLHAVLDSVDPDTETPNGETHYGVESWAFISPDHLSRLKDIVEGTGHQYFVDSSPQAYIKDVNGNGILEENVDSDGDGDVDADDKDRVILVCGQRKGGTSYFALDVTEPYNPVFLWRISASSSFSPDHVISELGESWSEPRFGQVKTSDTDTDGTAVFFIGGGFSSDNSAGKAVMAIDVFTGAVVKSFVKDDFNNINTDMNYSIPGNVNLIDEDGNGFVDKVYVGDLGGQMWRIGQFDQDSTATSLAFPHSDENINSWNGHVLFRAPTYMYNSVTTTRKFYYPPSVTLERGYDLLFMGTGDRDLACANDTAADRIYSIKDTHAYVTLTEADLVDVTNTATIPPDLDIPGDVDGNNVTDKGWYIRLVDSAGAEIGEKILAKGTVFYKILYITTFTPSDDPCLPGGEATIYALNYKTGAAVLAINGNGLERSKMIGGGVPSNPVPIITSHGQKLLVSVGSTIPVAGSDSIEAGIIGIDPLFPGLNFYYMWWREM